MQISSLTFIFIFLPIMGIVFFVLPVRLRSVWLLLTSLAFYSFLQPWYLLLMLGDVWLCFKLAPIIAKGGKSGRNAIYGAAVANLSLLVVASALNQIYKTEMPLGLFIYTLTSLGYLLDVKSGEAPLEKSFVNFGVLCCFFPKLYAGPLVNYEEMSEQIKNPKPSLDDLDKGITMFIKGLGKKVIIADYVTALFMQIKAFPAEQITVLSAWALVIFATISTYFSLSAASDIARGLGRIFGLKLPRNFYYPFEATTVGDFFARFNITVSRFIRKYVYTSLGSESGGVVSASLNIILISMLMGLWYGLRINLLVWGTVLGIFMIFERVIIPKQIKSMPMFYSKIYTFVVTFFSFAIFAGDSLNQSWGYLGAMFGLGSTPLYDDTIIYILSSNYLLIIVSLIAATSLTSRIISAIREKAPKYGVIFTVILDVALFGLTLGFML